jgi:hypothetical protein
MAPPTLLVQTIQSARRGLSFVHRHLQPPEYTLLEIVTSKWRAAALEAITRTGVADALYEAERDAFELALELGFDGDALFRLLRALSSDGLLERKGKRFGLTAITRPLASKAPNSMRNAVLSAGSAHNRSLWANVERGLEAGPPVFERLHGETFWEHLAKHPEVADEFDASMAEYTREAAGLIATSYDFGRFETLVDLGGGAGELLAAILVAHPKLLGVNLDLPHAVRRAPQTFRDRGVADRARVVEGSVFDEVPKGHDAYLMKNVLHEMLDDTARGPLTRVRQAMAPSGKLFIVENVVPEGDGSYLQFLDLIMLLGSGGKERTRPEFSALLASAGFQLERVIENASPVSLIVASPT